MTAPAPGGLALIAYDGSDEGKEAIRCARHVLSCANALVLHVYEPPHLPVGVAGPVVPVLPHATQEETRAAEHAAAARAREGREVAASAGFRAEHLCVEASGISGVASAIVAAAGEHDVDLIVIASRERSRILQVLFGSVSDSVVHRTDRPVLVVPQGS